jgi:hypothetical protein
VGDLPPLSRDITRQVFAAVLVTAVSLLVVALVLTLRTLYSYDLSPWIGSGVAIFVVVLVALLLLMGTERQITRENAHREAQGLPLIRPGFVERGSTSQSDLVGESAGSGQIPRGVVLPPRGAAAPPAQHSAIGRGEPLLLEDGKPR